LGRCRPLDATARTAEGGALMKEIKFRAWDKAEKRWYDYEDSEIFIDLHGQPLIYAAENPYPFANTDIELMQYTGLKDKNGKEIYEGDYLRCKQYIGGNFVEYHLELGYVEFVHGAFGLHRKQGFYRPFKDWLEEYELEVLGNIHDNPELLEVR
jgi:uncharacterized phage protein (TIGR01671 family)